MHKPFFRIDYDKTKYKYRDLFLDKKVCKINKKRAGIRNRLWAYTCHTSLPSILLAKVHCLENKLASLVVRVKLKRDIGNCNLLWFTSTWLNPVIQDQSIDKTELGKSRGGKVCLKVNSSWCDSASIVTFHMLLHTQSGTPDRQMSPFYLPWKFTLIMVNTVHIPLPADMDTALWECYEAFIQNQTHYQNAALIIWSTLTTSNTQHQTSTNASPAHQEVKDLELLLYFVQDGYKIQVVAYKWLQVSYPV